MPGPTISAPSPLGGVCPSCGGATDLRREITPATFSCRYWIYCELCGPLTDLATWLDRGILPGSAVVL